MISIRHRKNSCSILKIVYLKGTWEQINLIHSLILYGNFMITYFSRDNYFFTWEIIPVILVSDSIQI
jgi:hypothetical protein